MKLSARIFWYIFGILILALAVTLFTKADLGISALTCVPYNLSLVTGITIGQAVIAIYLIFVVGQFIIYRSVKMSVVLQIIVAVVFGLLVDAYDLLLPIQPQTFIMRLLLVFLSVSCSALGVALMIRSNLVINPPDGFVQAIADKLPNQDFGQIKLIFDCSMIGFAALIGFVGVGAVYGIGLGTLASALLTGNGVRLINAFWQKREALKLAQMDQL